MCPGSSPSAFPSSLQTSPLNPYSTIRSWSSSITAQAQSSPHLTETLTYRSFRVSSRSIRTLFSFTASFAAETSSSVRSLRTSRPYPLLPQIAPRAAAIWSPIIPVPGIPTPIPFLRMLPETLTSVSSGLHFLTSGGKCSAAFAAAKATAMGSVHPKAGLTSLWRREINSDSRSVISVSVLEKMEYVGYQVVYIVLLFDYFNGESQAGGLVAVTDIAGPCRDVGVPVPEESM